MLASEVSSTQKHKHGCNTIKVRGLPDFVIPCSCSYLDDKLDSPLISGMVENAVKVNKAKLHRFFLSCKLPFLVLTRYRLKRKHEKKKKSKEVKMTLTTATQMSPSYAQFLTLHSRMKKESFFSSLNADSCFSILLRCV